MEQLTHAYWRLGERKELEREDSLEIVGKWLDQNGYRICSLALDNRDYCTVYLSGSHFFEVKKDKNRAVLSVTRFKWVQGGVVCPSRCRIGETIRETQPQTSTGLS
jgi:hypothetical protein